MKYWPLTAVLLAFWLGSETGARDEKSPKITRFDQIHVRSIVVADEDSTDVLKLTPARLTIGATDSGPETVIIAGATQLWGDGRKDGSPVVGLVASGAMASVSVSHGRHGSASMYSTDSMSVVAASSGNVAGQNAKVQFVQGVGASVVIQGKAGKDRAVVGASLESQPGKNAPVARPESTVTLFDSKGKMLVRLPR